MIRECVHRSGVALRMLGMVAFSLIVLWSVSGDRGLAQTGSQGVGAGAEAVSVAMGNPPKAMDRAPYAAVPAGGGSASDSSVQYAIAGLGLVDLPLVTANGSAGSASATSWTSGVNLFGGRVRVSSLRVNASASGSVGQATASGDVAIEGLVVDNVTIETVEPSQSTPLPGIGTVIAREVQISQGGTVAMARGLRIVGDPGGPLSGAQLIIAGASAGVPGVPLSPPAVAAAPLSSVLMPRGTMGKLEPITRLTDFGDNSSSSDNDNFSSSDNDNFGDGNANAANRNAATITPTAGTPGPTATTTPGTRPATATPTTTPQPATNSR